MVTMTLPSVADRYPAGTVIEVYLASQRRDGASPAGSVVTSGTVQVSGSVTFTGLTATTNYVGYAFVESQHRYVAFTTPAEVAPDGSAEHPYTMASTAPDTVARGTAAATVALPAGGKLHSVLVVPTEGGQVTVTVFDDAADQAPPDFPYSEDFSGRLAPSGAPNLVIAGDVDYYRVTYEDVV